MQYLSVAEIAKKWGMSERSVRNYCAAGRVNGAFLTGNTWNIPENAVKPERSNKKQDAPITLLEVLKAEKQSHRNGGIYHEIQIDLTYSSNHIEGSRLMHDQTRYIFETNTICITNGGVKVDDIKMFYYRGRKEWSRKRDISWILVFRRRIRSRSIWTISGSGMRNDGSK